MSERDRRADALVAAPIGCAYLLRIERFGGDLTPLLQPAAAFHLLARAIGDVGVRRYDHAEVVAGCGKGAASRCTVRR